MCREEASRLIACLNSSILKETGIGVEVKLDGIAKNNEGIKDAIDNHVPMMNTGTLQPVTHSRRRGHICTKAWHEQKKPSISGWVGGGSRAHEVSYNARNWYCPCMAYDMCPNM